jgi:DNA-binding CsgD family transcriptional regulator/PAS domain-containing protein
VAARLGWSGDRGAVVGARGRKNPGRREPGELIPRVYEAAADPEAWRGVLEALAERLRGVAPGLFVVDREGPEAILQVTPGIEPCWQAAYDAYFHRCDLRRQAVQARPAGTVAAGHQLVPDDLLAASEFYHDFLRPQGLFHIAVALIHKRAGRMGVVRVLRPRGAEAFGEEDLALLQALEPHLGRAICIHLALAQACTQREALAAALAQLSVGAIVLDAQGRVLYANEAAEKLLAARDGIVLQRRCLRAESREETAALQALVADATGSRQAAHRGAGGALRVRRSSGAPALGVLVVPVHGARSALGVSRAAAVLYVTDPLRAGQPSEARLRVLFGLTRAEARVALRLVAGRTAPEIAAELQIATETVRSHRKQIFAKVDVHTQAELAQRTLALLPPVVAPERT